MKHISKRLVAMMMALLMMLSVGSALAQQADANVEEQGALNKIWKITKTVIKVVGNGLLMEEGAAQDEAEEQDFLRVAWKKVKQISTSTVNKVEDFAVDSYSKVKDGAESAFDKANDAMTDAYEKTKDALTRAWNTVSQGTKDIVNKVFEEEDGLVAGVIESVSGTEVTGDLEEQGIIGNIFKGIKDSINTLNPFSP